MLYQRRRNESINMVALMAALREIDRHESDAKTLSVENYKIEPVKFSSDLPFSRYTYFNPDEYFQHLPNPSPVLAEKIHAIIASTHSTLAKCIAQFCQEFGEPPALQSPLSPEVVSEVQRILEGAPSEAFYNSQQRQMDVDFQGGTVFVDSGPLDLPDLVIDPRDGGNYHSENAVLQSILDSVQTLQDWVPTPIQSMATDTYNGLTTEPGNAANQQQGAG
ncbi:MAG TPA: hypothetical protein VFV57_05900 [Limnobacter sp.]|nr:hypothetical protein [Limnobacter sp.]